MNTINEYGYAKPKLSFMSIAEPLWLYVIDKLRLTLQSEEGNALFDFIVS